MTPWIAVLLCAHVSVAPFLIGMLLLKSSERKKSAGDDACSTHERGEHCPCRSDKWLTCCYCGMARERVRCEP